MSEETNVKVALMEPVVIESQTPPEPPVGSVVLDPKGNAWQSRTLTSGIGAVWYMIGGGLIFNGLLWEVFITRCKSVKLIYSPEESD